MATLLAGCGGGGSSDTTLQPNAPPAPVTPAPPPEPEPEPIPDPEPADSAGRTLFESGQVRPIALSGDGTRLFVINTPAHRLEVFAVADGNLSPLGSVPVGLEPVAVAAASANEVWVVNHLSDSISIVRLDGAEPRVVRTLLVGDEPRDIVFAGPGNRRAFITAAYRGQNHPGFDSADLKTPGLGRADVWVFDADAPGPGPGGQPLAIINLFTDSARGLARSADGSRVHVAAFLSGNQTTTLLNEPEVANAKPGPVQNHAGIRQPDTGLIVGFDGEQWIDESGRNWSHKVRFHLPDLDLFTLDAMADRPRLLDSQRGLGTVLFNVASNPVTGAVYVSNMEARNRVRFEGPGTAASTVRGHIAEHRVSVVREGAVIANHLNPHVDFSLREGASLAPDDKRLSLAQPQEMAVSADGATLYLAAFGSNRIAAIATAQLEAGTYDPAATRHIPVPGGAPGGLVLNSAGDRLYTLSRYTNTLSVIAADSGEVLATRDLYHPEAANIRRGRRLLYDAELTSANGTASCATCHVFGDVDGLAWDLGNPDGDLVDNRNDFVPLRTPTQGVFHPLKGPMTTQTFRGIADSGPMHWRGDRGGRDRAVVRGELESLEAAAFKEFNPAFVELLGREEMLSAEQLQDFTDFALAITPPPNAIRNLDNSLTPDQAEGRRVFMEDPTTGGALTCNHCHVLDVDARQFGTAGLMTNEGPGITEDFKVAHLRNLYQKVGMFGASVPRPGQQAVFTGDQVRGFGLLHDGGIDTVSNFLSSSVFGFASDAQREQVVDFMFAFDGNLAPIVGQQLTIAGEPDPATRARLDLLLERARAAPPDCDLVVHGVLAGEQRGALLLADGRFRTDRSGEDTVSLQQLLTIASQPEQELTFTCVPVGMGRQMALDRNGDGVPDGNRG